MLPCYQNLVVSKGGPASWRINVDAIDKEWGMVRATLLPYYLLPYYLAITTHQCAWALSANWGKTRAPAAVAFASRQPSL